jgi:hypothetical protein
MARERSIAADIAYAQSTVIRSPRPEEEDEEEEQDGEGMARDRAATADIVMAQAFVLRRLQDRDADIPGATATVLRQSAAEEGEEEEDAQP